MHFSHTEGGCTAALAAPATLAACTHLTGPGSACYTLAAPNTTLTYLLWCGRLRLRRPLQPLPPWSAAAPAAAEWPIFLRAELTTHRLTSNVRLVVLVCFFMKIRPGGRSGDLNRTDFEP